jgi:tetratricopeptide (TPR) repeat protein
MRPLSYALCLSLLLPTLCLAEVAPRSEAIERAQGQLDQGDFEEAVKTLDAGLEGAELTDDQLVELYRLLGLAHLYLGNEPEARSAFEKLLQARPEYELPRSAPPKIRALYTRIKDDVKKRRVRPVTLSVQPPTTVEGDAPLSVDAVIEDLALGARAKLFYRRAGAQSYASVDFVREKGAKTDYRAQVPGFALPAEQAGYEVEFYVEVADAAQRRLAGRGDPFNPLTFQVLAKQAPQVPVPASTPWYQNGWVWVGVGVGVAAVTTGAVLLATQKQTASLPIKIQIDGTP